MKLLTLFLISLACFAQGSTPIVTAATGLVCTAAFAPATSATDIVIDCTFHSKPVLTGAKLALAAISGDGDGFVLGYSKAPPGQSSITILVRRATLTGPVHIEAGVDGQIVFNKDVVVP